MLNSADVLVGAAWLVHIVVAVDLMLGQETVFHCAVIDKGGLQTWFNVCNDPLINVAPGQFARACFDAEILQSASFYQRNSAFFWINGIDQYFECIPFACHDATFTTTLLSKKQ